MLGFCLRGSWCEETSFGTRSYHITDNTVKHNADSLSYVGKAKFTYNTASIIQATPLLKPRTLCRLMAAKMGSRIHIPKVTELRQSVLFISKLAPTWPCLPLHLSQYTMIPFISLCDLTMECVVDEDEK